MESTALSTYTGGKHMVWWESLDFPTKPCAHDKKTSILLLQEHTKHVTL